MSLKKQEVFYNKKITKMKAKNRIIDISKSIKIALFSAFLIGQTGCSDFLTEKAPSNLTPESFYTIPDHAEAAIASVYADLRFMGNGAGIFSSNWQLLERSEERRVGKEC